MSWIGYGPPFPTLVSVQDLEFEYVYFLGPNTNHEDFDKSVKTVHPRYNSMK